jgi:putative ABC transport system permease protein
MEEVEDCMRTLRNVFRRKMRAFLTIFGITIGVFALVVMGAMAEKITLLVDGGVQYYGDKVTITEKSSGTFTSSPLSVSRIKDIERVPGVAKASAQIGMLMDKDMSGVSMGVPEMIIGQDDRGEGLETFKVTYSSGRAIRANDRGKCVVGADLAKKLKAKVGSMVTLRDKKFEVVGILDKTLTAPDNEAMLSLHDAQKLFKDDLPDAIKNSTNAADLANQMVAYVKPKFDPDTVASRVGTEVSGIKATGPRAFKEQVQASTQIFTTIIFGIALISLLVGGLSVMNTMTMSVSERTREIGIRKSIGASDAAIMRQFVGEAALIGLVGGLSGLLLGYAFTIVGNIASEAQGSELFLLTARLAIGSVGFAVGLGVMSGLYPAWHAARLNPVQALRYE